MVEILGISVNGGTITVTFRGGGFASTGIYAAPIGEALDARKLLLRSQSSERAINQLADGARRSVEEIRDAINRFYRAEEDNS